jgi:hypothetical protein
MVRCTRLTKAIDAIAQGSNFNHEVIVLLCEIADMLEEINNKVSFQFAPEKIDAFYNPIEIPDPVNEGRSVITADDIKKVRTMAWEKEMVPKKRGRPFKKK